MRRAAVVAYGAVSAAGRGAAALAEPTAPRATVALRTCSELFPDHGAVGLAAEGTSGPGRSAALLATAYADCLEALHAVWPAARSLRIGLALGTSAGGMEVEEALFGAVAGAGPFPSRSSGYAGPVADLVREVGHGPCSLVLGGCAASNVALALGRLWLAEDRCDVALVGGFDALAPFVAAGFAALRATSAGLPRPFRAERDGLALAEGAAVLALARERDAPRALFTVSGAGLASDAFHVTAPEPGGRGLVLAAERALAEAGASRADVALVGLHGTGTPKNDPSELAALGRVLGPRLADVPLVPHKAVLGHALGAASALELLALGTALASGLAPAAGGEGAPLAGARLDATATRLPPPAPGQALVALKLASAFGGITTAVALEPPAPPAPAAAAPRHEAPGRAAHVTAACRVRGVPDDAALAHASGVPEERLGRVDDLTRLVLAAAAALGLRAGGELLTDVGLVVGLGAATRETNARFAARLRARGPRGVEPLVFPWTSPTACAGEASRAFGLAGPLVVVGGGAHGGLEALDVAATLVRAGAASRIAVVAADEAGPIARAIGGPRTSGAVGAWVEARAEGLRLDTTCALEARASGVAPWHGDAAGAHEALLPLVAALGGGGARGADVRPPRTPTPSLSLRARSGWGVVCTATLERV